MARTVGTLTLSRAHPSMQGAKLRCVEIVDHIDRIEETPLGGDTVIAWDLCGSGIGISSVWLRAPNRRNPLSRCQTAGRFHRALIDNVSIP